MCNTILKDSELDTSYFSNPENTNILKQEKKG